MYKQKEGEVDNNSTLLKSGLELVDRLETRLNDTESELSILKGLSDLAKTEIVNLRGLINDKDEKIEQLNQKVLRLEQMNNELLEENKKLKQRVMELENGVNGKSRN